MVAAVRDLHGEVGELSAAGAFPSHVLEEEEKTSCRVEAAWRGGVSELPTAKAVPAGGHPVQGGLT